MTMTPVSFTPEMLAYLALILLAKRGEGSPVADGLFACWLVGQAGVMFNGGYAPIPWFIAADTVTALYLVLRIRTKTARNVAFFFLPMIVLNATAYAQADPPLGWHYTALFALALAQVLAAIWGAWCGGLIEVVDHLSRRIRVSFNFMGFGKGARK